MFIDSLMRHLRRKGVPRRSAAHAKPWLASIAIEPLERRMLLSALDPFSLTASNVQIEGSTTQVVSGTFDLVFNVPIDQSPVLSGYEVHLAIDPADSGVALTGASEAANAVFAGSAPGVFQVGNTINVSDFLPGPGQQVAIVDGAGLATIAFEVRPNTVGLFNVVFTVVNLRDGDVNPVSLEETFDGMITVSLVDVEQNLTTIDDDRNTAADKAFTFTDADGDQTTVSIKGPGTLDIALVGGVTDNADISLLTLVGTDPSKTTVTVKVKRGSGDGETSIACIEGSGAKLIDARSSDLVGNTIELTGALGELKIDDILDGSDIVLGGTSSDKLKLTADIVGNVNLTFPGLIDKLQVTNWAGGSVHADAVKSIKTKGDRKVANSGAWGADLVLTGLDPSLKQTVGSFSADGPVDGAAFNVTGDVKSFTFKAAVSNSSFTVTGAVGKFDAKGATTDSALTLAGAVKTLKLGDVSDTDLTAGSTNTIDVVRWLGGAIALTDVKNIKTKGTKTDAGDFAPTSVTINAAGTSTAKNALGSAAIKGALSGGWIVTGVTGASKDSAAGKIQANAIDAGFSGHFMGDVGSLTSKSVFDGFASAFNFSKIDVKTSMMGATIIAGGGASHSSPNSIGSLKVGDSASAGTRILVGVAPVNGVFDDGDDTFKTGDDNFIKSMTVRGDAAGDSHFQAGKFPVTVSINKVKVDPTLDPRFVVS